MQKVIGFLSAVGILTLHLLAITPIFIIGVIFIIVYAPIVIVATIVDFIDEIKNGSRYGKK